MDHRVSILFKHDDPPILNHSKSTATEPDLIV